MMMAVELYTVKNLLSKIRFLINNYKKYLMESLLSNYINKQQISYNMSCIYKQYQNYMLMNQNIQLHSLNNIYYHF